MLSRASTGAKLRAKLHHPIRRAFRSWLASPRVHEEPIHAELFSVERLEQHAESLAAAQRVTPKRTTDRQLAKRLRDNDRVLRAAHHAIASENSARSLWQRQRLESSSQ